MSACGIFIPPGGGWPQRESHVSVTGDHLDQWHQDWLSLILSAYILKYSFIMLPVLK